MRNTTANIERNGDSSQASVVDVPWMYTSTTGRQRILCNQADFTIENSTYSKTALVDLIRSHPERFTPTVLTRPLLQDALLPTVASILGSAEMAYHRQLDDAYVCAGITQPFRILRSGMTLTSAKVSRYISKSGHDIHWYSRPWTGIEHDLAQELTSDVVPAVADLQHQLDQLIEPYLHAASVIDTTLIATVNAQRAGITSALESLTGKLRSAGKKKHAAIIDRARYVHSMVFPNDVLQERVFPLAMWEAEFGIDALIDLFDDIDKQAIGQHITAGPPSSQEHA
jgi:uncharacterized protein YllA (UPF0747 family)